MAYSPVPTLQRAALTLERSGTGWVSSALPTLGQSGKILSVKARLDPTEDGATAAALFLTRGKTAATPADEDVFYQSDDFSLTGSATLASLADALLHGAPYHVDTLGDLAVCLHISAGTGDSKVIVDILAEVWS